MQNSYSKGFDTAMKIGSLRQFNSSNTPQQPMCEFQVGFPLLYCLNRLDDAVFMAVPKPMLTVFDIHHRLESCEPVWPLS